MTDSPGEAPCPLHTRGCQGVGWGGLGLGSVTRGHCVDVFVLGAGRQVVPTCRRAWDSVAETRAEAVSLGPAISGG